MKRRALLLAIAVLVFLFPLTWTALASLGIVPDNSSRPPSWAGSLSLEHFADVGLAEPAFWDELTTSTVAALTATFITIVVSYPAAYALARSRSRLESFVSPAFVVLASLPAMSYVIPLSDLMRRAHLLDTLAGIVLSEAAVTAPLAVYVLHGACRQLSAEWEEAAVIDGAGLLRTLGQVVLPMVAPAVVATAIVVFVIDWNLLLVPLVLTSGEVKTVPVAMSDFFTFERELEWPAAAAALVISLAPVAVLVALFHRALQRFALEAVGPESSDE
ncbi:MAG TPA: carbohydrate ABC transporter permease [Candidatus Dormibacteraeota bacterium]|nr:carbohydrate ABC transporter permease [Candidatus Dormibacteraeota bacterium]